MVPDPTVPGVGDLLTFGGLSALVLIITEIIIRAWQPSTETKSRFGPLLSIAVALICAGAAALSQGADLFNAAIMGVFVGFSTSGLYDTVKGLYNDGGGGS